jgi:hypothetical protein
MTEAEARKLGAGDGMISALVMIKLEIGRIKYRPINPRHVRRIAARTAQIAPLKSIYDRLEQQLRALQGDLAPS